MDTNCSLKSPCNRDHICNLDSSKCVPSFSETEGIQTHIKDRKFEGSIRKIREQVISLFSESFNVKCSLGQDMIMLEEFQGELLSALMQENNIIGFYDISTGHTLCSLVEQLKRYWDSKPKTFQGFATQKKILTEIKAEKRNVLQQGLSTYFYNFDLWTTKFITKEDMMHIIHSKQSLFILVPTQWRYIDTNPSRVGAHHNLHRGGDTLYMVIPVGKEEEREDLLEWVNENSFYNYNSIDSIVKLDLSINKLESLPKLFGNLSNLQKLDLGDNNLNSLPESFGRLSNLQKLDLGSNKLKSLPVSFGNLSNLQEVDLGDNNLEILLESFGNLSNLQKLDLSINNLEILPESFGNFSNLQNLDLGSNKLKNLPVRFGNLSNLQNLDLGSNKLKNLPVRFGNLSNLQNLNLLNNKLKNLPESFGNLSNLQNLNLSNKYLLRGNRLKSLPESFGNLSNLQKLDLRNNKLKNLPESFVNLSNLQKLDLRGNRLENLPENIRRFIKEHGGRL